MKINLTLIISGTRKVLFFNWLSEYLDKEKFNLSFILINDFKTETEEYLEEHGFKVYGIKSSGKKGLLSILFKIYKILKKEKTDIIHTHLFEASLMGLIAAKIYGVKKRIHTRHHSNYHHLYSKKGVIYDSLINYLSTDIVAISNVVKNILIKEGVNPSKICCINHGFKLDIYNDVNNESIDLIKKKYNIDEKKTIIGVVSRYTSEKGIQYIISAFKKFLKDYPDTMIILANALGSNAKKIKMQLKEIQDNNSVLEIEYEKDMPALYKCMNIFIHTPIGKEYEAFGQIYVEAMAAGIPCIVTLAGIAGEYVINRHNALVVDYCDSEEIYKAMKLYMTDNTLKQEIVENGVKSVYEKFQIEQMITRLENLYLK